MATVMTDNNIKEAKKNTNNKINISKDRKATHAYYECVHAYVCSHTEYKCDKHPKDGERETKNKSHRQIKLSQFFPEIAFRRENVSNE